MVKISFIGAGRVGSTSAFACINNLKKVDEIVLIDINKELVEGEALDLLHASYALEKPVRIEGSDNYILVKDSDVVVITAGAARKPGISRLDLLETNLSIIKNVAKELKKNLSDETVIIVVTNPVDIMTYAIWKEMEWKRKKVIGMGSFLDTARLWSVNRCISDSFVFGEHGEGMFVYNENREIEKEVKNSAMEVIKRKGATFYAPAVVVYRMINAIIEDTKEMIPSSVVLQGEYGLNDVSIGVPVILGRSGVEKIIEIDEIRKKLVDSANILKKKLEELDL